MPDPKDANYFTGLVAVIDYFTRCYRNKEGKFEVKVSDDKGFVDYSISGGPTERGKRKRADLE